MGFAKEKLTESELSAIARELFDVRNENEHKGELHGLCPIHGERNPSFSYNYRKDEFFCFSCSAAGDIIKLFCRVKGFDDSAGFVEFCRQYGVEVKHDAAPVSFKRPAQQRSAATVELKTPMIPPALWSEKAGKFTTWAHKYLLGSKQQLKWLREERGISRESIEKYRLGWNRGDERGDLYRPREAWGLPTELKDGRKKKLWLPVGLVIPLLDGETVLRIRIRRPADDGPRYYILPGSSVRMFFKPGINCLVVESELDFILVDQEAVALVGLLALGSAGAKPDPDIDRHLAGAGMILNALDFDEPGFKASTWWEKRYQQTKRWPVPIGKDPTDSWKAGVSIRYWIACAFPKGWTGGPSQLGQKNFKVAEILETIDYPASVGRLYELLKTSPVAIQNTAERLRLLEPAGWVRKNWEASREISNLVYFDPDVIAYLSAHPEKMITGKNFFYINK